MIPVFSTLSTFSRMTTRLVIGLFLLQVTTKYGLGQSSTINFEMIDENLQLNSDCTTSVGTLGTCIRPEECPQNRLRLTQKDICFFENNTNSVICCEKDVKDNENKTESSVDHVEDSNHIADAKCADYIERRLFRELLLQRRNGEIFSRRLLSPSVIVGGIKSKPKDHPQMAAIGWKIENEKTDWKCGGILISSGFIVTAAHCTSYRGQPPVVARVGGLQLLKEKDVHSQDFNITNILVHPDYKPDENYHDIALIQITPKARLTEYVQPACLWTKHDIPNKSFIALGYGTESFGGPRTNELFEAKLDLVENESCVKVITSNEQIPKGIIESQLCAKDSLGRADTCQGDSGGPLLFKSNLDFAPKITVRYLVGITSFGEFCAGSSPGVYTRISSYIDWIESIVWPED